jgi:nitrate reductase NapD
MRTDRLPPKFPDIEGEVHIAGVLVQTRPERLAEVLVAITQMPAAEVQQTSPDGRLVVVVEAPGARHVVRLLDEMRQLTGVLDVALVYQHAEPEASLQEEMPS